MQRSQDSSPLAWLLLGALVLAGLGAALARRSRRQPGGEDVWAPPAPVSDDSAVDEVIEGHPS